MIRLSPTSTRSSLLAFGAIALVPLLVGISIGVSMGSGKATSVLTPTAGPTAGLSVPSIPASSRPAPVPTRPVAVGPAPVPTDRPCDLPARLPPAPVPTVAPAIEGGNAVSMLFTSHLSLRDIGGTPVISDDVRGEWAVGLWFVAAGTHEARLLVAPDDGVVLPLALSPDGTAAAVWWLPIRRPQGEVACMSGIYRLSTVSGESELVLSGDWTVAPSDDEQEPHGPGIDWTDPATGDSTPRTYRIPEVAMAIDGHLAIIDGPSIGLYAPQGPGPERTHVGGCTDWAWSSTSATFVAGCESMTSAWLAAPVCCDAGLEGQSIAMPWLQQEAVRSGWGRVEASTIGFTDDGRVRVAAFLGYPTGCDGQPCSIPLPGFVTATFDGPTGEAVAVRNDALHFLVDSEVRMSATASWLYAERYEGGARTLTARTGAVSKATRLGTFVGSAVDGSVLYGMRSDEATGAVIVSSLDAEGTTRQVATIRRPDGALSNNLVISAFGLLVIKTPS